MYTEIALWATVLTFTIHLAGHIFDKIAVIPNWNSGTVEDMNRFNDFFRKGQISTFFILVLLSCFFSSLLGMICVWGQGGAAKTYAIAAFVLFFATALWISLFFIKKNLYLFGPGKIHDDPERLRRTVRAWTRANHLRFVILLIALGLALAALENYRTR